MDKVQHFEIPADDLARAKKFYSKVFGWKINPFSMPGGQEYLGLHTTEVGSDHMPREPGAINGGMFKRSAELPVTGPTIAVTVDDIKKTLNDLKAAGGTVLSEIMNVADMGLYSYVKDTEGNVIGVWQNLKKK